MGFTDWAARKGDVGGTARAVAQAWKTLREKNPSMTPDEVAQRYIAARYSVFGEQDLARLVYSSLPEKITPLGLAWHIYCVEHEDVKDVIFENFSNWYKIMREEIKKQGVEPE
jgi:predicted transcriptional regulator